MDGGKPPEGKTGGGVLRFTHFFVAGNFFFRGSPVEAGKANPKTERSRNKI
jgi:hypothetical protein